MAKYNKITKRYRMGIIVVKTIIKSLMERKDLRKTGEPILTTKTIQGLYSASYYLVKHQDKIVGVGLFHNGNEDCTLALIENKKGEKLMLGHFAEGYPVPDQEFFELNKIYDWAFGK